MDLDKFWNMQRKAAWKYQKTGETEKEKWERIQNNTPHIKNNLKDLVARIKGVKDTYAHPNDPRTMQVQLENDLLAKIYLVQGSATPSLADFNPEKEMEQNAAKGAYSIFLFQKNTSGLKDYIESHQEPQFYDTKERLDLSLTEQRGASPLEHNNFLIQTYDKKVLRHINCTPSRDREGELQEARPTYEELKLTKKIKTGELDVYLKNLHTPALLIPEERTKKFEELDFLKGYSRHLNEFEQRRKQDNAIYKEARETQLNALKRGDEQQYFQAAQYTGITDEINFS